MLKKNPISSYSPFLFIKRLTGNRNMLKAYKARQYHIIEELILKKNYIKCPYNYALLNKEYEYLSFLLENYSQYLDFKVDKDFVNGCYDIKILKIFKKKYPTVIEMLELFHIRSSSLNQNNKYFIILILNSLFLNFCFVISMFILYKLIFIEQE